MNTLPVVSLLVAMRNEAVYIEECILSIINQDYPPENLEVIILDGLSEDGSREVAERLIAGKTNYRLVKNSKRIQSAAWNLGIELSHGEIISIVSGHSKLLPDYVSKAVETMQRTNIEMVGGTVRAISPEQVGKVIALAISMPFGVGNARFRYTEIEQETETVFMGFCKRAVYERHGGFDEELVRNQDDEFSYRLRKVGGKIICNPKIVSHYSNRATLTSLWSQYYQYGFWKVRVLQKHPLQMSPRQFVPPLFVLALFVSIVLAAFSFVFTLSALFLFIACVTPALYITVNLFTSIYMAYKHGWKYFPLLPLVFGILHLSYGLGFLAGLFKFQDRWGDKIGKVPGFKKGNYPV